MIDIELVLAGGEQPLSEMWSGKAKRWKRLAGWQLSRGRGSGGRSALSGMLLRAKGGCHANRKPILTH